MEQKTLTISEGSTKSITVRSPLPPRLYCTHHNNESKILIRTEVLPEKKSWLCPSGINLTQLFIRSLPHMENGTMTSCNQVITNEYQSWKEKPTSIFLTGAIDGIRDYDRVVTVLIEPMLICSSSDTVIQTPSKVAVSNIIL